MIYPIKHIVVIYFLVITTGIVSQNKDFKHTIKSSQKPWTQNAFENNPENFQFAIVSDRTGGHRKGIFGKAIKKLNLLMPEFVMSVGDLIEGYSKRNDTINKQWKEFDSLVNPLQMKFFALPGNHDISNSVMRKTWMKRYGQAYYYFTYKNVLFLALDTNDGDGDAVLSKKQVDYFKNVINQHKGVRWTMIFMHHPIWLYRDFNGFKELENLLPKNKYSVYAGHFHHYLQMNRNESNYYVLASTGGGSELRGPKFGEFDHVTWITMTDKGPKMLNLRLNGMLEHDIVTPKTYKKKQSLLTAADFSTVMTYNKKKTAGSIYFGIKNTSTDTIFFDGNIFHNHHLQFDTNKLKLQIPPKQSKNATIHWKNIGTSYFGRFNPVVLNFTIGYKTNVIDNPFKLEGTYTIPKTIQKNTIQFNEPTIFPDNYTIELTSTIKDAVIRYTLDNSVPTKKSTIYKNPITISKTTTIKAAFFNTNVTYKSDYLEQTYKKVKLLNPVQTTTVSNGLTYTYYEGNFTAIPDFKNLTIVKSGIANNFKVDDISGKRIDHYAIQYTGFIDVPEDGLYTFYTRSDDGSKMYIHDKLVVDNGGSHSTKTKKGYITLKKGKHPITINYFEDYLGQELSLYWKLPSAKEKQQIDFKYLSYN